MYDKIKAVAIKHSVGSPYDISSYSDTATAHIYDYHKSFPCYSPTPLVELPNLSIELGVESIHIKDESYRFGLNAFKVLGGSYAIGRLIAEKNGIPSLRFENVYDIGNSNTTLVTATDGNHGRAVAWTAAKFGLQSVVYLPKGSSSERLENILSLGSTAYITDLDYDDCVRLASKNAKKNNWILIQDTQTEGSEHIAEWIMHGYTTMAREATDQLCGKIPTHVFLQAGVGSTAAAVTAFLANRYRDKMPLITVIEPISADCIFQTALFNDDTLHRASGDLNTIMSGLSCGEVCSEAWRILRDYADYSITVPDSIAEDGMRILGYPLSDDTKIISGESGAVTVGLVSAIMKAPELSWLRSLLHINSSSRILCFSTEGNTDRESYNTILSKGRIF